MIRTAENARKRRLFLYFTVAYAVSWAIEIPLALKAQGLVQTDIPSAIHYLAAFGPLFAGIIATGMEDGSQGLKELLGRVLRWRVALVWWVVALSWLFWAIWHVPSFFYLHTVTNAGSLVGFLLGVLAGAVVSNASRASLRQV